MDINSVILTGRLTRDPDLKHTKNGTPVCSFTLAVNGMKQDDVSYLNILTWKNQAENCGKHLKKGSQVALSGKINQRTYEGKNGKVNVVEVVAYQVQFLSTPDTQKRSQNDSRPSDDPFSDGEDISDSDLPF